MIKRPLFCDVCASETEHLIDEYDTDDDGEDLALCSRCGRLRSLPHDGGKPASVAQQLDTRPR